MTKTKFFALLADNLKHHNGNGDAYRSADYRAEAFHDPRQDNDKTKDWVDHAASIVLADCWYMTFTTHKTADLEMLHRCGTLANLAACAA